MIENLFVDEHRRFVLYRSDDVTGVSGVGVVAWGAVKSAAQAVLLAWGGGDVIGDLFVLDWQIALAAAGGGAVLSVLTSIVSAPIGADDSPSAIE